MTFLVLFQFLIYWLHQKIWLLQKNSEHLNILILNLQNSKMSNRTAFVSEKNRYFWSLYFEEKKNANTEHKIQTIIKWWVSLLRVWFTQYFVKVTIFYENHRWAWFLFNPPLSLQKLTTLRGGDSVPFKVCFFRTDCAVPCPDSISFSPM